MEFKQDPLDNFYEIGDELGSGQFAVVRRCRHRASGEEFAGKFIRKKRARASRRGVLREDIQREVEILRSLSHENIVTLHDVYENSTEVILLLELVSGGELFEYLSEREKVSEAEAVVFLKQILDGIQHMHDADIVHLDLKPENLMLLSKTSTRLKIIDFGLSRKLEDGIESRELLGTPEFVAPEVINYDPLVPATDMWAIGVITYILLSGCSPFLGDNKQQTLSNVSAVEYNFDNEHFSSTSDVARDFIQKLLVRDPRNRLSCADCLAHPWIKPQEERHIRKRRSSSIDIENLKSFVARRRWQQSFTAICMCNKILRRGSTEDTGGAPSSSSTCSSPCSCNPNPATTSLAYPDDDDDDEDHCFHDNHQENGYHDDGDDHDDDEDDLVVKEDADPDLNHNTNNNNSDVDDLQGCDITDEDDEDDVFAIGEKAVITNGDEESDFSLD